MTVFRSMIRWLSCQQALGRWPTRTARVSAVVGLVVGLASTTVVMSAGSASAAVPGLQIVSATSAFNSDTLKSATASCPSGKRVVGTGFHLLGAQGDIILDDLIPSTASVTVQGGEDQDGTSASWKVTALAVCANPLPGLQIVTASSPFGPAPLKGARATCPAGKRLVGSGASLAQGFGNITISNLLVGQDLVSAFGTDDQDGFSGGWSITAYAICADPLPGLDIARADSAFNSDDQKVVTANCPTGKKALGTGWAIGGSGQAIIDFAGIGESGVTHVVNEDDDGFTGSWAADAAVICASA